MYRGMNVGVAVPAHNEELLIGRVIETMPDFVDLIVVVDDKSSDRTSAIVLEHQAKQPGRIELIRHEVNTGVGGAVCDGYQRAYEQGMDVVAVMAGDAQMDPTELSRLLDPVADKQADYVKGNRLLDRNVGQEMPRHRLIGNNVLTLMTKIASGYWHVSDAQGGYTALSRRAIELLDLKQINKGYEFENSMLVHLNVSGLPVLNVPVRPIYRIGEVSGIRWSTAWRIGWYLVRAFFWRLWQKYLVLDTHPLVFFYLTGLMLVPLGVLFGLYLVVYRLTVGPVAATSALFAVFLTLFGWQFLLFAMWFDMQAGRQGRI